MRLAIGDVYKVRGYGSGFNNETLNFTFEIVGEVFVYRRRYVVGIKHNFSPDCQQVVIFDSNGYAEEHFGEFKWQAWEISRAKPQFQR